MNATEKTKPVVEVMTGQVLTDAIRKNFPAEAKTILEFLERGFPLLTKLLIYSLLVFAKQFNAPFIAIMEALEREWNQVWQAQEPDVRGSPNAPAGLKKLNCDALERITDSIRVEIPLPM